MDLSRVKVQCYYNIDPTYKICFKKAQQQVFMGPYRA